MLGVDQAAVANHADQTARGVSAAAKADRVDFGAVLVLFGEELIALNDIKLQSGPDRAADIAIVPLGSDALVVPLHLLGAIGAAVCYRLIKSPHVGLDPLVDGECFVGRLVPSPIETNNNSLHARSLGDWSDGVLECWGRNSMTPLFHYSG